jgi:HD-like signal output (HDOD) protein
MAGLLHGIGTLVFMSELDAEHGEVQAEAKSKGTPTHVAELAHFGATHAEVGGYLLGLWGLPYPIVEAVANHHEPSRAPPAGFGVLGAVHVSQAIVQAVANIQDNVEPELDHAYLEQCGVTHRVAEWTKMATELSTSVSEQAA